MMKSHLILFVFALMFAACRNNNTPNQKPEENVATIDTTMVAIPDPQDLLEILHGTWQSKSDPTYRISIVDDQISHWYNGQLKQTDTVEIDASCAAVSCSAEGRPEDGWCFIEKSSAGDQCMLVLHCNGKTLQIKALGSNSPQLDFVKI